MTRMRFAAAAGVLACCGASAAVALASGSPSTITGSVMTVKPSTVKPGTAVPASDVGSERVFVNANDGFALVAVGQAQYVGATTNGGRTWKTLSPVVHENAAQAPLSVTQIGAASTKTVYAFGSGQAVDITGNGGKTWYQALFQGTVEATVPGIGNHVVTYEQSNAGVAVSQYVTKNGGHTWTLTTALGGG